MGNDFLSIDLIRAIRAELLPRVGLKAAITARALTEKLEAQGFNISEPTVREVVHHLRTVEGIFICGGNRGYSIAGSAEERVVQIRSLTSRIAEMQQVLTALKKIHDAHATQSKLF